MISTLRPTARTGDSSVSERTNILKKNPHLGDFVISKNKDGTTLSKYSDKSWDRTPYDSDGTPSIISFNFWKEGTETAHRNHLAGELKWIFYLLLFERQGPPLSNGSLKNYLKPLNAIARFCDERKINIKDVFYEHSVMLECMAEQEQLTKLTASLVNFLNRLGPEIVGYEVASKKTLKQLQQRATAWAGRTKQHPPIPTRIYSEILSILNREIEAFLEVEIRLFRLLEDCLTNPLTGRGAANQWKKRKSAGLGTSSILPNFTQLLLKYDLVKFWQDRGYSSDIRGLSVSILEISIAASLQIQAYTGMRANEVAALPYDCLDEAGRFDNSSTTFFIKGRIRKIVSGKSKPARWVTSQSGVLAVRLAQRLAMIVFLAKAPTDSSSSHGVSPAFLFLSPGLFGAKKTGNIADLKTYRFKSLDERLPIIAEEDLVELEQIDPHRAWRAEERFKIGQRWAFSSHQLRRSLALYAQRSGLVSLPTLKRQLHHLTAEMSTYYGRGSAFAKKFMESEGDKKHFSTEWQAAQPVSQYLSYAINVLSRNNSELFGVHPQWVKHRLTDDEGIVRFDRAVTLKRFQKGELSYQETLLGGCAKVGECDKNPLDLLHLECIKTHCKNMVGNRGKLERVVIAQSNLVNSLARKAQNSAEFRHENSNLLILQRTLDSLDKIEKATK